MTLRKISEQVSRLYARVVDQENIKPTLDPKEAKVIVIQVINKLLAVGPVDKNGISADVISSSVIATYRNQSVLADGSAFYVNLPAHPVRLPHDMGVLSVAPDGSFSGAYIPVPSSMWDLIASLDEADLENQVGFYPEGDRIYFTKDPGVSSVKVKLIVVDPYQIGDTDMLPLPADLEIDVIKGALQMFGLPPKKINKELGVMKKEDNNG